jgi:salicylate hydroxylase
VSVDNILADPEISWIAKSGSLGLWYVSHIVFKKGLRANAERLGHNAHVMTYSISKGELFNLVLTHPERNEPGTWDQSTALAEMKAFYHGWDPMLTKLLDMVVTTQKWPIQQIDIPSRWVSQSSKLVLLGDAAHAMLPNMALGAAMAVEDAATLAECLKSIPDRKNLRDALDLYQQLRIPRAKAVQEASDLHGYILHYPDGPLQEARDAAMRPEVEGKPFADSPNQWSDPATQQFCYSYDVIDAVHDALEQRSDKQEMAMKHYVAV